MRQNRTNVEKVKFKTHGSFLRWNLSCCWNCEYERWLHLITCAVPGCYHLSAAS